MFLSLTRLYNEQFLKSSAFTRRTFQFLFLKTILYEAPSSATHPLRGHHSLQVVPLLVTQFCTALTEVSQFLSLYLPFFSGLII